MNRFRLGCINGFLRNQHQMHAEGLVESFLHAPEMEELKTGGKCLSTTDRLKTALKAPLV